jgi:hypothetical protein
MKALTICQPYAELILLGEKLVENRVWNPVYRGPLLVHAGKSKAWLDSYQPLPAHMDFGALVGICELEASFTAGAIRRKRVPEVFHHLANHAHVEGPYCLVLTNVARFDAPVPFRGQQGMFDVPIGVIAGDLQALAAIKQIPPSVAVRWFSGVYD